MTAYQELKDRKNKVAKELDELATKRMENYNVMECCKPIAKILKVSPQTIYNYTKGKIKDGYLAESIVSEFSKYDFDKLFK